MGPMILVGEATVYKHGKAKTLYLSIPSKVAQDSAFTIKDGDKVVVRFDPKEHAVIIQSEREFKKKEKQEANSPFPSDPLISAIPTSRASRRFSIAQPGINYFPYSPALHLQVGSHFAANTLRLITRPLPLKNQTSASALNARPQITMSSSSDLVAHPNPLIT